MNDRNRGIFVVVGIALIIFVLLMHWKWWSIVLSIVIMIILWLLFREPTVSKKKKKKPQIIGTYIGWMVTWMPNYNVFAEVRGENAMRLAYGRADIYSDGYMESIPESFRMTYYIGGSETQRRFNPFYDGWMLKEYARKQGKEVPFADGTDLYIRNNITGVRVGRLNPPNTVRKLQRTNSW